jgi:hypothetical protein
MRIRAMQVTPVVALISCLSCSAEFQTTNEIVESIHNDRITGKRYAIVNLAQLTPFSWDLVYFFPPGATVENIQETLSMNWPDAARSRVMNLNSHTLVIFTRKGAVVHAYDHPRSLGDFSPLSDKYGYPRDEDTFLVFLEGDKQWLSICRD